MAVLACLVIVMMKPYDYHDTDDGIDYKIDRYTVARDALGASVPCSLFLVHSLQCLVLVFAIRCCSAVQVLLWQSCSMVLVYLVLVPWFLIPGSCFRFCFGGLLRVVILIHIML